MDRLPADERMTPGSVMTAKDIDGGGAPEGGFATVSFLAAVAVSLAVFVAVTNLLVFGYARGAARVALDEGARAGARADDPTECTRRAEATLDDLLGGPLRAAWSEITCADDDDRITASVEGRLQAWAPVVPDWFVAEQAVATTTPTP